MWRIPTTGDLQVSLMADEVEGFQTASVTSGQDAVQAAIDEAVRTFRGAIRSGGKNSMGSAGTLPEECIGPAMDRAAYKFLARIGGKVADSRQRLYDDSRSYLKEVSSGLLLFAGPDEEDASASSAAAPSITPRTPTLDRTNQQGL